ncbi:MAG: RIP metalloprotease RseP [Candidatus Kapabacteria bacterium]|nr:RIP metalloprotease RseP [Candidatus Kapabacteria bacterium]
MELISNIFYFIIVIGILVAVHEFGHFIAARLTGMRANVFCIGMGKRLFGWNKINGFTFGNLSDSIELGENTDYRIAAFPIGGYVKISGMVDESFDTNFAASEPQPYEFRSKGTLAKLFVLSAGVIMNLLLAIVVFSFITFTQGKSVIASTKLGKIESASVADRIGLKEDDDILSVNGAEISSWSDFVETITLKEFGNELNIELKRENEIKIVKADGTKILKALANKESLGLSPGGIFAYVDNTIPGKPAEKAGIQKGDTLISINGIKISGFSVLQDELKANKEKKIELVRKRQNEIITDSIISDENGMIGVQLGYGPFTSVSYGFFESIKIGTQESIAAVELLINSIKQIIMGNLSFKESIAGPVMIMDMAGEQADRGIESFLRFLALLSISLAFMNILPFPALDGGHIIFVLIEGITRREVSTKVKMAFQQGGIIILLLFMAFVLFNDITRLIK